MLSTQYDQGAGDSPKAHKIDGSYVCSDSCRRRRRCARRLITPALQRGAAYLEEHADEPEHSALWIDKGLFAPGNIVRSIILGTLASWQTLDWA
jgi:hypothetical protein